MEKHFDENPHPTCGDHYILTKINEDGTVAEVFMWKIPNPGAGVVLLARGAQQLLGHVTQQIGGEVPDQRCVGGIAATEALSVFGGQLNVMFQKQARPRVLAAGAPIPQGAIIDPRRN